MVIQILIIFYGSFLKLSASPFAARRDTSNSLFTDNKKMGPMNVAKERYEEDKDGDWGYKLFPSHSH
jgi:hypothetical protein